MKPILRLLIIVAGVAASGLRANGPGVSDQPPTWRGVLVDAGCRDRSITNLRKPPSLAAAAPPDSEAADPADTPAGAQSRDGDESADGIRVDAKTVEAERKDQMKKHTQDHLTRQMDASCAITAGSHGFALLLRDGTLLNLDEGGNTKAFELFQSSPKGRQILNGKGPGEKPRAVIRGTRRGDQLDVIRIRFE